jgi:hypothetical protein
MPERRDVKGLLFQPVTRWLDSSPLLYVVINCGLSSASNKIATILTYIGSMRASVSTKGHFLRIVGVGFGRTEGRGAQVNRLKARARWHYVPGSLFAEAYTGLGEKNRALGWMERAYEEQGRKLKHVVPLLRCRNVGHTTVPFSYSAGVSAFENGLLQAWQKKS